MIEFEGYEEADDSEIQIPIIDILLAIIFFLISFGEMSELDIPYSPERINTSKLSEPMRIDVLSSGGLRINDKDMTDEQIQKAIDQQSVKSVLIRADRSTKFEHVFRAQLLCRKSGVMRIAWEYRTS